jgi:hypothetical protein
MRKRPKSWLLRNEQWKENKSCFWPWPNNKIILSVFFCSSSLSRVFNGHGWRWKYLFEIVTDVYQDDEYILRRSNIFLVQSRLVWTQGMSNNPLPECLLLLNLTKIYLRNWIIEGARLQFKIKWINEIHLFEVER